MWLSISLIWIWYKHAVSSMPWVSASEESVLSICWKRMHIVYSNSGISILAWSCKLSECFDPWIRCRVVNSSKLFSEHASSDAWMTAAMHDVNCLRSGRCSEWLTSGSAKHSVMLCIWNSIQVCIYTVEPLYQRDTIKAPCVQVPPLLFTSMQWIQYNSIVLLGMSWVSTFM